MNQQGQTVRLVRFGPFEVDARVGELRKHGMRIKLQDQPFQILLMLLDRRKEVVTRDELRERLWSADTFVDFDHSLNTAINKLREALNDSADSPRYIETLPRRGYRFIAEAAEEQPLTGPEPDAGGRVPAVAGEEAKEAKTTGGMPPPPILSSRRALQAGAGMLALLLILLNFDRLVDWLRPGPAGGQIESLAVLPLEYLPREKDQEYFAVGMQQALITNLQRVSGLRRVIDRISVEAYRDSRKPLREIAGELNVDALITGTVQRSGNRVRFTMTLYHRQEDRSLWAQEYEREMSDILALTSEMARALVEEIRVQLTPEETQRLAGGGTVNPEAYEAYLKGHYFWNQRTEEGFARGLSYLQQAVSLDPNYPMAYVTLADLFDSMGFFNVLSPQQAYPQAKRMAEKALQLDPALGEAHASLGSSRNDFDWDWAGAEQSFQRAIALNPNYAPAHQRYAAHLAVMRRFAEARVEIERAHELAPLDKALQADGIAYYYARDYASVIRQANKVLELDPNFPLAHIWLGMAYQQTGKYAEAAEEFQKAKALPGETLQVTATALLAHANGRAGKQGEARRGINELRRLSGQRYVSPGFFSLAYVGLGDRENAFQWMEKAYQERSPLMVRIQTEPMLDGVRDDPRFQDFLRRMKFPQKTEARK